MIKDCELKLKSYSAVLIILLGLAAASFVAMRILNSPVFERIALAFIIFSIIIAITWALRKLNKPDSAKPEN